jgi:tRNA-binding EMAP/Myf-like protein
MNIKIDMIQISPNANVNYLAKVVKISNLRKHNNADRLQITSIDFQDVIVDLSAKEGDIYVFFPLESQINPEFLSHINAFRHTNLNRIQDDAKPGFFCDKGRVKAMKLRGEKSMGYLAPVALVEEFFGEKLTDHIGEEFDTIGDKWVLKKYLIPSRNQGFGSGKGKKPKVSRLIENQVRLHVDTENLRKNAFKIDPADYISLTYKLHGTSFWVANVMVKKKLSLFSRILKFIGIDIVDFEYDHVYGSRKVVKNGDLGVEKPGYYSYDLWGEIKDRIKDNVPKNYTLYGECVGHLKGGKAIQAGYDYGCKPEENEIYIYRITITNVDGLVIDLSSSQVRGFCDKQGLKHVPLFFHGKAMDLFPEIEITDHWHEEFVKKLEALYNDKDCYICVNKVPEEGVVVRREKTFNFEAYKLKSFSFLEYETKLLDSGDENIEDQV